MPVQCDNGATLGLWQTLLSKCFNSSFRVLLAGRAARAWRGVLWERLRKRGVHGFMLKALKRSYDRVHLGPRVNGVLGEAFPCDQGVKQGDSLSPDLFGLFIETLADFIDAMDRHRLPVTCPVTGTQHVWMMCPS